jgi:hypothetical protein
VAVAVVLVVLAVVQVATVQALAVNHLVVVQVLNLRFQLLLERLTP